MNGLCDACIRPMRPGDDHEVSCGLTGDHDRHNGVIRDYAFPGSATTVEWHDDDRRTYHGVWPGDCALAPRCLLPAGHRGRCAT